MTLRLPWLTEGVVSDPRLVWKIWDEFEIEKSRMVGFWDDEPVVETGNPYVKATAYVKPDHVLIAIGNFSDESRNVSLAMDWEQISMDPGKAVLIAPYIQEFQEGMELKPSERIRIPPREGYLFYLVNQDN